MNLYHLATWIAIPLLGLGSIAVFITFLIHLLKHRDDNPKSQPPES